MIKNIYNCQEINNPQYSLERWYNLLINKTDDELTISDVLTMLRQNVFINLAVKKAIEMLSENPYAGEGYEGQLIINMAKIDSNLLKEYSPMIKPIILKINPEDNEELTNKEKEWICNAVNFMKKYVLKIAKMVSSPILYE